MSKQENHYRKAKFAISAPTIRELTEDTGIEVAFAGRSNAGKSSALNTLTEQSSLARTSKTPGRTQLINVFDLDEQRRLIDLPGYGYAKVPEAMKKKWQAALSEYLQKRQCLKGVVVVMDIRHPLKEIDQQLIYWAADSDLHIHLLLTKSDKLKSGARKAQLLKIKEALPMFGPKATAQTFSSLKRDGVSELRRVLNSWYEYDTKQEQ